jgi:hypothetical protein
MDPFAHRRYRLRRQVLKLRGAAFRVYDADGRLVLYAQLKGLRLREDLRLYADESCKAELLTIRACQLVDFAATYDVEDARTGAHVGALRRQGFKSLLRDEWAFLDAGDVEIGAVREDSLGRALVRRFVMHAFPQTFHATIGEVRVATYRQHFNPIVQKLDVDFRPDDADRLDRRLGLAAAVLLCAIEGRQQ